MKTYVLTGYSHKLDGFVFVTKAEGKDQAIANFIQKCEQHMVHVVLKDENGEPSSDVLIHEQTLAQNTMEEVQNYHDQRDLRYAWYVAISELKYDTNLVDAVQW